MLTIGYVIRNEWLFRTNAKPFFLHITNIYYKREGLGVIPWANFYIWRN